MAVTALQHSQGGSSIEEADASIVTSVIHHGPLLFGGVWGRWVGANNHEGGRTFLLGCRGKIYARAIYGEPLRIQTMDQFGNLRPMHRITSGSKLPYKRTYGLPIEHLTIFSEPYMYTAPRGAVGIVVYRGQ